ncbi:MAG: prolyl oligopeptidase family serine peptidase [Clostridiaceae bacterium]|nr:prolyl oligopeptidase family serine peptidase [Clostridiaceae bacterium]
MRIRLLGFLFSIGLFVFFIFQKKFRRWKKAGLVIASFILIVFMALQVLFPLMPAPQPTGSCDVLTETAFYQYTTEISDMTTNGNEREIPVKVWLPKDTQAQSHPLFLFSPGSFGVAESNETLFLELASRGYIVVSLNHPYHSFISEMSDGRTIGIDGEFLKSVMSSQGSEDLQGTLDSLRAWSEVRIDDINAVLDQALDSQTGYNYEQYIDPERIILSGHSLGGSAVLAIGRERPENFQALVILEAPFVADIVGINGDRYVFTDEMYPLPILHIYSDALYSRLDEITTYEMNARLMNSDNPMYVNEHILGVGHLGLTDMILVTPVLTNLLDGGLNTRHAPETLLELNGYVLDFLSTYNQ